MAFCCICGSLALVACSSPTGSSTGNPGNNPPITPTIDEGDLTNGDYRLNWAGIDSAYVDVRNALTDENYASTQIGSNWMLVSGDDVLPALSCIVSNFRPLDSGVYGGAFAKVVAYSNNGITAPQALKTALTSNKSKGRLAGIYKGTLPANAGEGEFTGLFYIEANKFTLEWAGVDETFANINDVFLDQGIEATAFDVDWALITEATATSAYNYATGGALTISVRGDYAGTLEQIVAYSPPNSEITIPSNLKAQILDYRIFAPLAGISDMGTFTGLFYIKPLYK